MKRIFSILLVLAVLISTTVLLSTSACAESYATVTSSNGSSVRLRKGPGKSYITLKKCDVGTTVTVLQTGTEWTQILAGSTKGWMMNEFLNFGVTGNDTASTTTTATTSASGTTAIVVSDNGLRVWLRSAPKGTRLFLNAPGTTVTVLEKGSVWSHVSIDGTTGYMMTKYLSFEIKPVEPKALTSVSVNYTSPSAGDVLVASVLPEDATYSLAWAVETGEGTNVYTDESTELTLSVLDDYEGRRIRLTITAVGDYTGKLVTYTKPVSADFVVTGVKFGQSEPFTAGTILTAVLSPSSATVDYSWRVGGTVVSTGSTYTVQESDSGKLIQLKVSGIGNYSGIAAATAANTVADPYELNSVILNETQPIVGEVLTASILPTDALATYSWYADGQLVADGTISYMTTQDDLGKKITVKAEGIYPYTGTVIASTAKVSTNNVSSVTISNNTPKVGNTLVAIPMPVGATVEYRWLAVDASAAESVTFDTVWANGVDTGVDYTVSSSDKGYQIFVAAKGVDAYGGQVLSAATATVPEEERTEVTYIGLNNYIPVVGDELMVDLGTDPNGNDIPSHLDGDTHSYLWIIGTKYAYGETYTVKEEDVGKTIQVRLKIDGGAQYYCDENGIFSVKTEAVAESRVISEVFIEIEDSEANAASVAPTLGEVLRAEVYPEAAGSKVRYSWYIDSDAESQLIFTGVGYPYAEFETASYPDCLGRHVRVTVQGVTEYYTGAKAATTAKIAPAFGGNELQALVLNITEPVVDDTLKVSNVPEDATADYIWYVDGQEAGTGKTYKVKYADLGKYISVHGMANGDYTGEADAATGKVSADNVDSVTIDFTMPQVGTVLNAVVKPVGATVECRWLVVSESSKDDYTFEDVWSVGTSASSYTVDPADEGMCILVAVKGNGIYGGKALSSATGKVTGQERMEIVGISISNTTPVVDDELEVEIWPEDSGITSSDYSLTWIVGTNKYLGETYTVKTEDYGKPIQVQFSLKNTTKFVCAENGVFSVNTSSVVAHKSLKSVTVYIKETGKNAASSTPLCGQTLYIALDPEAAASKCDIDWYANNTYVSTGDTFTLGASYAKSKVKVVVTGTTEYYTGSVTATTLAVADPTAWEVEYPLTAKVGQDPVIKITGTTDILNKDATFLSNTAYVTWWMDSDCTVSAEYDQFGTFLPNTQYYAKLTITAPEGYKTYGLSDVAIPGATLISVDYATGSFVFDMGTTDSRLATIYYITEIAKPVEGVKAVTSFENEQYEATIDWGSYVDGSDEFIASATYEAEITITAKPGYVFYNGSEVGTNFTVSTATTNTTTYTAEDSATVNVTFNYGSWDVQYNLKAPLGSVPASTVTGTTSVPTSETDPTPVKVTGKVTWWMDSDCDTTPAVVDQYGNFKPGTLYYAKVEINAPGGYVIHGLKDISDAAGNTPDSLNRAARYAIFEFTTDDQKISIYYITEIAKPVAGKTAVTEFSNDQYEATVTWTEGVSSGRYENTDKYVAEIDISPKSGYILSPDASFTVSTADSTTTSGSTVTATFTYDQELKLSSDYTQVDMNGTDNRIVHCFAELTHQDGTPAGLTWVVSGRESSGTTMSEDGILTVGRDEPTGHTLTVKATCQDSEGNDYYAELSIAVVNDGTYSGEITVEFRNVPNSVVPGDSKQIQAYAVNSMKGVTYSAYGVDSSTDITDDGILTVGSGENTNIVIVAKSIEDPSKSASIFIPVIVTDEEAYEEEVADEQEENEMNHLVGNTPLLTVEAPSADEAETEGEEAAPEETVVVEEIPSEETVEEGTPIIEIFGNAEDDGEQPVVELSVTDEQLEEAEKAEEAAEEEAEAESKPQVSIVLKEQDGTEIPLTVTTEANITYVVEEGTVEFDKEMKTEGEQEGTIAINFAAEELYLSAGSHADIEVSIDVTGIYEASAADIAEKGVWLEVKGSIVDAGEPSYIKDGVLYVSENEKADKLVVIAHSNAYPLSAALDVYIITVDEPAEEPAEEPVVPAEEPAEEPTEEPAEEPAEEPTEEPVEEPAEEQPAEESTEEQPAEEPAEEQTTEEETPADPEKEEGIDPFEYL